MRPHPILRARQNHAKYKRATTAAAELAAEKAVNAVTEQHFEPALIALREQVIMGIRTIQRRD